MSTSRHPGKRGRPVATDPDATRRRILDAARRVFADEGYSAALGTIAARAGVTAPAISHHFGAKRDLFRAVADDADATLLAVLDPAASEESGFSGRLQALVDAAITAHRDDPSLTAFLSVAQLEFQRLGGAVAGPDAGQRGVVGLLWRIVTEAEADGELSEGADPAAVVALLLAVTLGVAFYATVIDPSVRDGLFDQWRLLVGGELFPGPAATSRPH